jgi:hypothetical protein
VYKQGKFNNKLLMLAETKAWFAANAHQGKLPKDVFDQMLNAAYYMKRRHMINGDSGVTSMALIGTDVVFTEIFWYEEHLNDNGVHNYKGMIPYTQYQNHVDSFSGLDVKWKKYIDAASNRKGIEFPYDKKTKIDPPVRIETRYCSLHVKEDSALISEILQDIFINQNPRDHISGDNINL